jgi:hypothetical protein
MSQTDQDADDYYFMRNGERIPRYAMTAEERSASQREQWRRAGEQAAAESAAAQAFEARVEDAVRERLSSAPSVSDLNIDTSGLSAARERLVRGLAWIERVRGEIPELSAKRSSMLEALGAPASTKAQLQEIETAVGLVLRQYFENGSKGEMPDRQLELRAELVERLKAEDEIAGQVAAEWLADGWSGVSMGRR